MVIFAVLTAAKPVAAMHQHCHQRLPHGVCVASAVNAQLTQNSSSSTLQDATVCSKTSWGPPLHLAYRRPGTDKTVNDCAARFGYDASRINEMSCSMLFVVDRLGIQHAACDVIIGHQHGSQSFVHHHYIMHDYKIYASFSVTLKRSGFGICDPLRPHLSM